jgi:hypothetical protein
MVQVGNDRSRIACSCLQAIQRAATGLPDEGREDLRRA